MKTEELIAGLKAFDIVGVDTKKYYDILNMDSETSKFMNKNKHYMSYLEDEEVKSMLFKK